MDAGGSDLFESYENDFNQVSASIGVKINSTIPSQAGGNSKTKCEFKTSILKVINGLI